MTSIEGLPFAVTATAEQLYLTDITPIAPIHFLDPLRLSRMLETGWPHMLHLRLPEAASGIAASCDINPPGRSPARARLLSRQRMAAPPSSIHRWEAILGAKTWRSAVEPRVCDRSPRLRAQPSTFGQLARHVAAHRHYVAIQRTRLVSKTMPSPARQSLRAAPCGMDRR